MLIIRSIRSKHTRMPAMLTLWEAPSLDMRLPRMTTCRRHCMLLLIAVAMPPLALGQDGAARDGFDNRAERKAQEDEKAVKEFIVAYHLEPGENLKLVPTPRPASIHAFWRKAYPTNRQGIASVRSFVFASRGIRVGTALIVIQHLPGANGAKTNEAEAVEKYFLNERSVT